MNKDETFQLIGRIAAATERVGLPPTIIRIAADEKTGRTCLDVYDSATLELLGCVDSVEDTDVVLAVSRLNWRRPMQAIEPQ